MSQSQVQVTIFLSGTDIRHWVNLVWKKCPISNGNMKNETDTDKTISRGLFHDSSK